MSRTRIFKALSGTKESPRIVNKIAIYDENDNQIDCCIIHKNEDGKEFYYPSNPHHKFGLFGDLPKDMIECIRNDFGDVIVERTGGISILNSTDVIRFIDRTYGEPLRQKTIEGWKNAKFKFGIKFSFVNSMSAGCPVSKDKTLHMFNEPLEDILSFDSEGEAQSFINSIVEVAREWFGKYCNLELTGDRDTDYNNTISPFFDEMESKIEGGIDSVYWKVFSALDDERKSGNVNYNLKIIQLVDISAEDEEKGWTITYVPWEGLEGKPRVAGRFKTTAEKDAFLESIYDPNSGWIEEEYNTISIHNDYNYMLPV